MIAIHRLHQEFFDPQTRVFGYHPGINLHARDSQTELRSAEVDIAAIVDGQLVIAECKSHGIDLTPEIAEKNYILAQQLSCSRLIFAAGTEFSESLMSTIPSTTRTANGVILQVNWWNENDLFDGSLWRGHDRAENGTRDTRADDYVRSMLMPGHEHWWAT